MSFRFEAQPRRDAMLIAASLQALRTDAWRTVGVFTLLPTEYEELADVFEAGGVEVIRSDAAEPVRTP